MRPETRIIVNDRFAYSRESKKYRSTQEQIERNQREKMIQRERDERARSEAYLDGNHNRRSAEHQDTLSAFLPTSTHNLRKLLTDAKRR